jgi:hypothetical protein
VALLVMLPFTGLDDHFVCLQAAWAAGQRDHGAAVSRYRLGRHAGITGSGAADEFVDRHLVGAGEPQE